MSRSCPEPEPASIYAASVTVGSVVWCNVGSNYPAWPSKVTDVQEDMASVETFEDNLEYENKPVRTLIPFTKLIIAKMVKAGRKKLKKRPGDLKSFECAVRDAMNFNKSTGGDDITEEDIDAAVESNASCSSIDTTSNSFSCAATPRAASVSYPMDILTTSSASPFVAKRKKSGSPESNGEPKRHCKESNQRLFGYSQTQSSIASFDVLLADSSSVFDTTRNDPSVDFFLPLAAPSVSATTRSSPSPSPHRSLPIQLTTSTPKDAALNTADNSSSINSLATHSPSYQSVSIQSTVSDSDDELPVVNLSAKEITSGIKDLKKNDILWVKYGRHPFWPSLLSNVNIKKKRIRVFFLGWSDIYTIGMLAHPTGSRKNVASYRTADRDLYIKAGLSSKVKEQFDLSLKEADKLLQLRLDGEIQGTPLEQMMELIKLRPRYKTCSIFVEEPLKTAASSTPGPAMSAFGFDIGKEQKSLFDHDDEEGSESNHEDEAESTDSDAEDERGLYTFKRLQECFEECKAELSGICNKEVHSDLHDAFIQGNLKQKRDLRMIEKFGPGAFLSDSKKSKLLDQLLEITSQVTGGPGNFPYSYDVLLPEAIARTISKVENCSLSEAWDKFSEFQ